MLAPHCTFPTVMLPAILVLFFYLFPDSMHSCGFSFSDISPKTLILLWLAVVSNDQVSAAEVLCPAQSAVPGNVFYERSTVARGARLSFQHR